MQIDNQAINQWICYCAKSDASRQSSNQAKDLLLSQVSYARYQVAHCPRLRSGKFSAGTVRSREAYIATDGCVRMTDWNSPMWISKSRNPKLSTQRSWIPGLGRDVVFWLLLFPSRCGPGMKTLYFLMWPGNYWPWHDVSPCATAYYTWQRV